MQKKIGFEDAVAQITAEDTRFEKEAYFFLREALDFTVKDLDRKDQVRSSQHVSGPELLDGVRRYALEQFGPMVPTVFEEWGVTRCGDFGNMVFHLIESGVFGKSDTDRPEDFEDVFDFEEAFVLPYRPKSVPSGKAL
ncbi:MAG: Minf_1886 family protein [Verrucomicrobiota bacterium]